MPALPDKRQLQQHVYTYVRDHEVIRFDPGVDVFESMRLRLGVDATRREIRRAVYELYRQSAIALHRVSRKGARDRSCAHVLRVVRELSFAHVDAVSSAYAQRLNGRIL